MRTNHRSLVGTDDGPGPDLGPNPGIGNARGIKEGIGEDLVVGKMIERENGIQGTLTGHIGVEPTGKVVRAGMEEAWALTAPWRNGWVFDLPRTPPTQHSKQTINSLFVGESSPRLFFALNHIILSDLFLRSILFSLVLVVHAISSLPLDPIYLRFCDAHLQNLYIMVIISSYLIICLHCSATQSLRLCYLVPSLLSHVCLSCL